MVQLAEELLLGLLVALGQVQHEHAGEEVGPKEGIIGKFLVGVEEEDFFPVLSLYLVGGHVYVGPGVLAEKPTCGLLLLADEEIDQKAFADLLGANKSDDIKIGVAVVVGQVVDEFAVHLEFVVAREDVKDGVGGSGSGSPFCVEDGVFMERLLGVYRGQHVVLRIVKEREFSLTVVHFKMQYKRKYQWSSPPSPSLLPHNYLLSFGLLFNQLSKNINSAPFIVFEINDFFHTFIHLFLKDCLFLLFCCNFVELGSLGD